MLGGCLPNKTRIFFAIVSAVGLILFGTIIVLMMSSPAAGVWEKYNRIGPAFALLLGIFISAGILAGTLSRVSMSLSYFDGLKGTMKYFVALAALLVALTPILIPVTTSLAKHYKESAEKKIIKDARTAQLENLWMTDLTLKMQDHTLTLPYAARLHLQLSRRDNMYGKDKTYDPEKIYKDVYRFRIHGPQQRVCSGPRPERCTAQNKLINKTWKRWCELRPDMAQTFWCFDELNVLRMEFTNLELFEFEERKYWLENLNSKERPIPYRGRDYRLIIHKALGLDKRGEVIFSVCSSHTCTLDYAVEEDILGQINYNSDEDHIPDEALQKYIEAAEARWKGLKDKSDGLN